jgi:transposase-like protein
MNLKSRGVKEVGIIISDALSGIENTINKHFPGTEVQKSLPQITEKILHN